MVRPFLYKLLQSLLASYRGYYWVWHLAAALITAVIVVTGFDWWFFEMTRSDRLFWLVMFSGAGGFLMPIIFPLVLYVVAKKRKDEYLLHITIAVVRASAIAWIIVATYKIFTGRIQPDYLSSLDLAGLSSGFQFGFFEHGIFWGWPSHHTAVAFASMTVLYLAWRNAYVRFAVIAWALIVGVGAAVGFHWFSDVVAGAIIGSIVGISAWRGSKI
jgi:membrane-associated phospholipid phosphatase